MKQFFLFFPWSLSCATTKTWMFYKIVTTICFVTLTLSHNNTKYTGFVHFIASFFVMEGITSLKLEKLFFSVPWCIFITFALWESDFLSSGAFNAPTRRWFMSHLTWINNSLLVLWCDWGKYKWKEHWMSVIKERDLWLSVFRPFSTPLYLLPPINHPGLLFTKTQNLLFTFPLPGSSSWKASRMPLSFISGTFDCSAGLRTSAN